MRAVALAFAGLLLAAPALAQVTVYPPQQPDMSGYATKSDLSAQATKQSAIPTAGPGPGLCRLMVVPSPLVSSGGVPGAAGTCSRIVQCGTSADYVVTQFNIGGGC